MTVMVGPSSLISARPSAQQQSVGWSQKRIASHWITGVRTKVYQYSSDFSLDYQMHGTVRTLDGLMVAGFLLYLGPSCAAVLI